MYVCVCARVFLICILHIKVRVYVYIYITMHKWKRKGKGLLEHRQPLLGVYAPHHTGVHLWGLKWLKSWNVSAQDFPKFRYEHGLGDMSWNVELRLEKKLEEIPRRSLGDWHLKSSLNTRWPNELYLPSGWELSRVSSSIFLMKWCSNRRIVTWCWKKPDWLRICVIDDILPIHGILKGVVPAGWARNGKMGLMCGKFAQRTHGVFPHLFP